MGNRRLGHSQRSETDPATEATHRPRPLGADQWGRRLAATRANRSEHVAGTAQCAGPGSEEGRRKTWLSERDTLQAIHQSQPTTRSGSSPGSGSTSVPGLVTTPIHASMPSSEALAGVLPTRSEHERLEYAIATVNRLLHHHHRRPTAATEALSGANKDFSTCGRGQRGPSGHARAHTDTQPAPQSTCLWPGHAPGHASKTDLLVTR